MNEPTEHNIPSDVIAAMTQQILMRQNACYHDKKHYWIGGLTMNKTLFVEQFDDNTNIEPMTMYRMAVLKNAEKAVLVRSDPSGEPTCTQEDKDLCHHLIQAGRIIHIPLEDYLIITPHSYLSFADTGLLQALAEG